LFGGRSGGANSRQRPAFPPFLGVDPPPLGTVSVRRLNIAHAARLSPPLFLGPGTPGNCEQQYYPPLRVGLVPTKTSLCVSLKSHSGWSAPVPTQEVTQIPTHLVFPLFWYSRQLEFTTSGSPFFEELDPPFCSLPLKDCRQSPSQNPAPGPLQGMSLLAELLSDPTEGWRMYPLVMPVDHHLFLRI